MAIQELRFEYIPENLSWKFIKKIQQDATIYQPLLFHIYIKLNMCRATHRPSSGA
jgi:hypothetical protein